MTAKTKYLFFRIHPFNLFIAFFYSLRGCVFAYEISLPKVLCRRFRKIDPESYVDWDGWSEIREKAFYLWREMSDNFQEKRWTISILGYKTNFSKIAKEVINKEFEKMIILMELMKRMEGEGCQLIEPGLLRFSKKILPGDHGFQKTGMIKSSILNARMDYMNDLFINFLYFAQFMLRILRLITLVFKKTPSMDFEYLWCGINPNELKGEPDKLDFAWAVKKQLLLPDKVLYFLPAKVRPEVASDYKNKKVNIREPKEYFDDLAGLKVIGVLLKFVRSLFTIKGNVLSPYYGQLTFRFACQSYLWGALVEHYKSKFYLTTQSVTWPEMPEVAVCNAMGMRTITWSYSANYMLYRTNKQIGRDLQVALSSLETRDFLVWNELSSFWIKSRLLNKQQPEIKVIGPLMNGDSRICLQSPQEARISAGIGQKSGFIYVSIFDIPTISKKTRLENCLGPTPYPEEMVNAFYEDIIRLSKTYPRVKLILKPKRSFNEEKIVYSQMIKDLYKDGNIIFMEYDINPYIPIAVADVCIGLPFTSPVLAGIYFERLGLYHDPLDIVRSHMYHGMDMLISHGYLDLESKIKRWLCDNGKEEYRKLLDDDRIKDIISKSDFIDPLERFRNAVSGVTSKESVQRPCEHREIINNEVTV